MEISDKILIPLCLTYLALVAMVTGSGVLLDPPSRGVMWKEGFPTETNFNYMQLNCGGVKQSEIGYRQCGVCGDADQGPRLHEFGNRYGTGTISRYYEAGVKEMTVRVELLAFEKGFFEFRMCPANNKPVTQECLNQNLLPIKEGYVVGMPMRFYPNQAGTFDLTLAVPPNMTCERCVIQWRYRTANSWGVDPVSMKEDLGQGPQEEFYNCADIRIGGTVPDSILSHENYTQHIASGGNAAWDAVPWPSDINFPSGPGTLPKQDLAMTSTSGGGVNILDVAAHPEGIVVNAHGSSDVMIGQQGHVTGSSTAAKDALGTGQADANAIVYEQLGMGQQGSFASTAAGDTKSVQSIMDTIGSVDAMTFVDQMLATGRTDFPGGDMFVNSQSSFPNTIDNIHSTVHTQSATGTVLQDVTLDAGNTAIVMDGTASGNVGFETHSRGSGMVSGGDVQGAKTFIGLENFNPLDGQSQSIVNKEGGIGLVLVDPLYIEQPGVAGSTAAATTKDQTAHSMDQTFIERSSPIVTGMGDMHHADISHSGQAIVETGFGFPNTDQSMIKSHTVQDGTKHGQTEVLHIGPPIMAQAGGEEQKTASLFIEGPRAGVINISPNDNMMSSQTEPFLHIDHTVKGQPVISHPDSTIIDNTGNAKQKTASLTIDGLPAVTLSVSSSDGIVHSQTEPFLHIDHTITGQTKTEPFLHIDHTSTGQSQTEPFLHIDHTITGQSHISNADHSLVHDAGAGEQKTASLTIEGPTVESIKLGSLDGMTQSQTEPFLHIDHTNTGQTKISHNTEPTVMDNSGGVGQKTASLIIEEPQIGTITLGSHDNMMQTQTGSLLHIDHTLTGSPAITETKTSNLFVETPPPESVHMVTHNVQTDIQHGDPMMATAVVNEKTTNNILHNNQNIRTIYMTSQGEIVPGPTTSIQTVHSVVGEPHLTEKKTTSLLIEAPTSSVIQIDQPKGISNVQPDITNVDYSLMATSEPKSTKTASLLIENPTSETIQVTSHTDAIHDQIQPTQASHTIMATGSAQETSANLIIETPQSDLMFPAKQNNIAHGQMGVIHTDQTSMGPEHINIVSPTMLTIPEHFPFNTAKDTHSQILTTVNTKQSEVVMPTAAVHTVQDKIVLPTEAMPSHSDGMVHFDTSHVASDVIGTQSPESISKDSATFQTGKVHLAQDVHHGTVIHDSSTISDTQFAPGPTEVTHVLSDLHMTETGNKATDAAVNIHSIMETAVDPVYQDSQLTTLNDPILHQSSSGQDKLHTSQDDLSRMTASVGANTGEMIHSEMGLVTTHGSTVEQGIHTDLAVHNTIGDKALGETNLVFGNSLDASMVPMENTLTTTAVDKQLAVGHGEFIDTVAAADEKPHLTTDISSLGKIDHQLVHGLDSFSSIASPTIPSDVNLGLLKTEQVYAEPIADIQSGHNANTVVDGKQVITTNIVSVANQEPTLISQINDPTVIQGLDPATGSEIIVNNIVSDSGIADPAYTEVTSTADTGTVVEDPSHISISDIQSNLGQQTSIQADTSAQVVPVEIRIQGMGTPIDQTAIVDPSLAIKDPFEHIPAQSLVVIPLEPTDITSTSDILPDISMSMAPEPSVIQTEFQTATATSDTGIMQDAIPMAIAETAVVTENIVDDIAAGATSVQSQGKSASLSDILLDLRNVKNRLRNVVDTPRDMKPEQVMIAESDIRTDGGSITDVRTETSLITESGQDMGATERREPVSEPRFRFLRDPRTGMMTRVGTGIQSVLSQPRDDLPPPGGRRMTVTSDKATARQIQSISSSDSPRRTTAEQMPPYVIERTDGILEPPRRVNNVRFETTMTGTGSRDRRGRITGRTDVEMPMSGRQRSMSFRTDSGRPRAGGMGMQTTVRGSGMQTPIRGSGMQSRGPSRSTFSSRGMSGTSMTMATGMTSPMARPRMPVRTGSVPMRTGASSFRTGSGPMSTSRMSGIPPFPRGTGSFSSMSRPPIGRAGMSRSMPTMPGPSMGTTGFGRPITSPGMSGPSMGSMGMSRPVRPGMPMGSSMGGTGFARTMGGVGMRPSGPVSPTMAPVGGPGFGTGAVSRSMPGTGMFSRFSGMSGMGGRPVGMGASSGPMVSSLGFGGGSRRVSMPGSAMGGSAMGGSPGGPGFSTMFRPGFDSGMSRFGSTGFMPVGSGFPMIPPFGGTRPMFR